MTRAHPQAIAQAFIALGSNLENPLSQVRQGFEELTHLPSSRMVKRSSLYRSAPIGRLDQPDFINAVAHLETAVPVRELLDLLLQIEHRHGRVRTQPNGPRTLDLDILLYDQLSCNHPSLVLPHPRMHLRAFVLAPLLEIAPGCHIPGRGPASGLIAACAGQSLEREAGR